MIDRTIAPHVVNAERAIIGAILLDNDSIDRVGRLLPEHFYDSALGRAFAALSRVLAEGKSVDPLLAGDMLPDFGVAFFAELAVETASAHNVGRYADMVIDRARRRALLALSTELAEKSVAYAGESAEQLIDAAQAGLDKLMESGATNEPVALADDLAHYVEALERRQAGQGNTMATGFPDLDRLLNGGLRRGEVVLVAARPKVGKTAFALALARHVAASHHVLVLEQEMPRAQLHDRNMAAVGRIELKRLLDPNLLTEDDWTRVASALSRMQSMRMHVDDQGGLRLLDVRAKARSVKRRHGLDLLVIDYLQLMEADGDSRNAQIEQITRGLKALAKELDVSILLLSQLNRELERRPNKRPQPSDLRDSGAIEQDCDVALFLYRDELYNPDTMDKGIVEVNVGLNRQGPTGTVGLAYIGEHTRFESLEFGTRFGQAPEKKQNYGYSGVKD